MVLATLVVLWSIFSRGLVVVDRHTTFLLNRRNRLTPWLLAFGLMHRFTIRHAFITIVTNEHLASLVKAIGGNPFVLPDKLPSLDAVTNGYPLDPARKNILLISSFSDDEPIAETVEALSRLKGRGKAHLYVSGRVKRSFSNLVAEAPPDVTFTNFLPERDYVSLLTGVDVVVSLTTSDHTMLCGCYEAVAAEKPLVTSDKAVLRDYFRGAIFADNSAEGIAASLDIALAELDRRRELIRRLKAEIVPDWSTRALQLERLVASGRAGKS